MPKEVILIEDLKNKNTEVWVTLTDVCREYTHFNYHMIKCLEFPFKHKGYSFSKKKLKRNPQRN